MFRSMRGSVRWVLAVAVIELTGSLLAVAGSLVYTKAELVSLLEKWRIRDGEASLVLSDALCESVIAEPGLFLATMEQYPSDFEEWLSSLGQLSFVDYGGGVDLERRRQQMIASLERADEPEKVDDLKRKLLDVLRSIRVRSVE